MYAGDAAWYPSVLDFNHDDYFDAHVPGCPDLASSALPRAGDPDDHRHRQRPPRGSSVTSTPAGINCPGQCTAKLGAGRL
jgi:hypothetical protein